MQQATYTSPGEITRNLLNDYDALVLGNDAAAAAASSVV